MDTDDQGDGPVQWLRLLPMVTARHPDLPLVVAEATAGASRATTG
jgi:hypothetical protein